MAPGMEIAGYAGPLVAWDKVYVGYSEGHVAAYDARDGSEKWPAIDLSSEAEQALGEVPRYLAVDTTPVADTIAAGRVIYVASYAGGVYALDAETGSRVWSNAQAAGVSELMLWQEPEHPPTDGVGPPSPGTQAAHRRLGEHRALGAVARRRQGSVAARAARRRGIGAGPDLGGAHGVDDALRLVPLLAGGRRRDRRRQLVGGGSR